MGLGEDARVLAERERELIRLKDNYEETMAKMREKRATMEGTIATLREEAGAAMIEMNRLKSLIINNKRVMEEAEAARARLGAQITELCTTYKSLVSPLLTKRLSKVEISDIKSEIDFAKLSKDQND